ncbi:hypothetical protein ES703_86272 [subsurface metagenome]
MMRREAIKKQRTRRDRVANFSFAIAAGLAAAAIVLNIPALDELNNFLCPAAFLLVFGFCIYKWVIK